MFTGIITDKGKLKAKNSNNGLTIEVETSYDTKNIAMGASVACSGVCLTVVAKADGLLSFDVSEETISKTNVGEWKVGDAINFERPLKVGDELGGHIVSGHVDGVVEIIDISDDAASKRLTIRLPKTLAPYVAEKGSVTLDGVSLTVNGVADDNFDVNIVPHTLEVTSLGEKKQGDKLNMEIDVLARYLSRLSKFED